MPKEVKDMTNAELVEEFHNAAMSVHADFGFGRPHMECAEAIPNLALHAALKCELLNRLMTSGVGNPNPSSDEELVEELINSLIKAFRDPILGPIMYIDSAKKLRVEAAIKALSARLKELREVGTPRKKPTRMAVVGRKAKK